MLATKIQNPLIKNTQFFKVKSITPCEKDIIKNVYGNDTDIPQTIYNRIQDNLEKGLNTNAVLKVKIDNESIWINNRFEPSSNNMFKNRFTVKTTFADKTTIEKTQKLYCRLKRLESHIDEKTADKYLEGYLEEQCISFNELTKI